MNIFTDDIRKIYTTLVDEESKYIFANRLLFNLLGDGKYMDKIVRRYAFKDGINERGVVKYLLTGVEDIQSMMSIVVYGCGEMGAKIYEALGERISCFCDRSREKQEKGFCGKKVISLEELEARREKYRVIIGSIDYYFEIYKTLEEHGIKLAADNRKEVQQWLEVVSRQYFDKDIISYDKDEVFVDGGCLNYASAKQFLAECSSVKKIYAFEPDEESAKRCREEAAKVAIHDYEVIEKGLYSEDTELHFASMGNGCSGLAESGECIVKVCAIDTEIKEPVTFIKMDIEGAELEALKGAADTIRKYHPKLAICVYHKPEDVIDIPKYILELNPEYRLYMRHYSDNAGETVLYAI